MNIWDRDKYLKAWKYATLMHSGQTYGGSNKGELIDYINHIGAVAMELIYAIDRTKAKTDANLAIQVAILHDTIEDTDSHFDEIENLFGKAIADGVSALSKDSTITDKDAKMKDSLRKIKSQPKEIWMVKMADRISNLYHPPYYWDKTQINFYFNEAKEIYNALNTANNILAERLAYKIEKYKQFL